MLAAIAAIDVRFTACLIFGAVAGVVLFHRGFRMLQFKRLVLNTPFSKIRSASMGLVEVSGAATGPHTVPAGITGAPCFYYCATAWELKESGNNSQWKKVAEETLYVPFFVDDSTGRLLVNPQGAHLDVHRTFRDEFSKSLFSSNGRDLFPENVRQFLLRNGVGASGKIRLEEHCIEPGYPLFILGTLAENPDRGAIASDPQAHITASSSSIRMRSRSSFFAVNGNELVQSIAGISTTAFDDSTTQIPMPGAANVPARRIAPSTTHASAGNWSSISMDDRQPPMNRVPSQTPAHASAAGAVHSATAVAEKPQTSPQPQAPPAEVEDNGFAMHPPVVLAKGSGNDPFTISSQSQRDVVNALAWQSAACIWGGPLLTLVCFYILSQVFGW